MARLPLGALMAATGLALLISAASPTPALAYIGPGLGLSMLASLLSVLVAVLLGIVGFLWYPMKRLIRAIKTARKPH